MCKATTLKPILPHDRQGDAQHALLAVPLGLAPVLQHLVRQVDGELAASKNAVGQVRGCNTYWRSSKPPCSGTPRPSGVMSAKTAVAWCTLLLLLLLRSRHLTLTLRVNTLFVA